ncbi:galactokinase [Verrucomicrobia bacterium]|nr:galactokinase [Verrucomicrobiota bacterium]
MDEKKTTGLRELIATAMKEFEDRFGGPAELMAVAPGRVNLIGEHIDYNDGFVLPMAIERWTAVVGRKVEGINSVVRSVSMDDEVEFEVGMALEKGGAAWPSYVLGVVAGFQEKVGIKSGFEALILSSVPLGGGLSSSASLEVAFATFLESLTGHQFAPKEKALLCQRAEHEFAGVPCGVMDQFTASLAKNGHLLLLDCQNLEIRHVPFGSEDLTVLIVNTNVRHELNDGEYAKRRAKCESALMKLGHESFRDVLQTTVHEKKAILDADEYRRAKHVVTEIARTLEAAENIESQNWERFGELMYESHYSLRDDFEVSCRELDELVCMAEEIGIAGGIYGCRMTGGGFGGCVVALVETSKIADIKSRLRLRYLAETGIEPDFYTSRATGGGVILS